MSESRARCSMLSLSLLSHNWCLFVFGVWVMMRMRVIDDGHVVCVVTIRSERKKKNT
jgi:hypothetical protein